MTKRTVSLIISVLMVFGVFACIPALPAHAETEGDWVFTVNSAQTDCIITNYTGDKNEVTEIKIPSKLRGYRVINVGISFSSFPNLETMTFYKDSSITEMLDVRNCTKLTEIRVSDPNTGTFTSDTLPDSITKIPNGSFAYSSIKRLTMPNVTEIGSYGAVTGAFEGCSNLYSISILKPAAIWEGSFRNISASFQIIYQGPLSNWTPGAIMYSPKILVKCNDGSFGWCGGTSWSEHDHLYWTLSEGNLNIKSCYETDIEEYPDKQIVKTHNWVATDVYSVTLENVTGVCNYAFSFCRFSSIELPKKFTVLPEGMFSICSVMSEIRIPSSVTKICSGAFANCGSLTKIYYDGTKEEWESITKVSDWDYGTPSDMKVYWRCGVTVTSSEGGIASADVTNPYVGETVTLTAEADSGYSFSEWQVLSENVTVENNSFTVPDSDVQIKAVFSEDQPASTKPQVAGHSLTLEGDIGVNFYADIPNVTENDYAEFTVGGKTVTVPVDLNNVNTELTGSPLYKFTCHVAAAQIDDTITGYIHSGTETSEGFTYSVQSYLTEMQNDPQYNSNNSLMALAGSIATYGYYANKYFGYNSNFNKHALFDDSAFQYIDSSAFVNQDRVITDMPGGLTYIGSSLVLRYETALRHYFTLPEGKNPSDYVFRLGDADSEIILTPGTNDGKTFVEISDIPSSLLGEMKTITVTDTEGNIMNTWTYSPLYYAVSVIKEYERGNDGIIPLVNVVKALALFAEASVAYFGALEP